MEGFGKQRVLFVVRWFGQRTRGKQRGNILQCVNIIEQIENANDWSSDHASDSENSSSSAYDSEESQPAPRSRLRPAGAALTFVPHADWNLERSYEGERTTHWNMQWKLCLKKREQTGESELGIVISLRRFWKHVLRPKVTTATAGKPWKEDDTKVVVRSRL